MDILELAEVSPCDYIVVKQPSRILDCDMYKGTMVGCASSPSACIAFDKEILSIWLRGVDESHDLDIIHIEEKFYNKFEEVLLWYCKKRLWNLKINRITKRRLGEL